MTKTASEMIFAKYYVVQDEMTKRFCVCQQSNVSGHKYDIMAEYTDRYAAEYICEQLNRHAALEAPE